MNRVAFAAVTLAALWPAVASADGGDRSTLAAVKNRGELLWGGDIQGGEPYAYEDPEQPGHLLGFEVEIADAIARRLGVKARFVQVNWSSMVPALERGDFDVAMNGLEATAERQQRLLLSRPYFIYAEKLAVKAGSPLRFFDLAGKRVGTLNQTYAFDILGCAQVDRAGADPPRACKELHPRSSPAGRQVDAVLLDDIIADRYGCNLAGVECVDGVGALGGYVVGMRKGDDDLQRAIDQALADMTKDGELRRILEKAKLWNARQEGPRPGVGGTLVQRAFDWGQARLFLEGAVVTLWLSAVSFVLAMFLGVLLAIARVYGGAFARGASATYVEIFRGTPVLLQLYVLYFALAPVLKLNAFAAAVLGLGLNYAAYEAEIYRGALLAIPRGQAEAAHSLGLRTWCRPCGIKSSCRRRCGGWPRRR